MTLDLNPDQSLVVAEREGPRAVVAAAGTGKSSTMVELIRALLSSGVSPLDIKAVTFSKEMAEALSKKLNVSGIVSTFHSLGYAICSETERKPVEPELRFRLMMKLIRKWGMEYKDLDTFIAKMRRENISPTEAMESGRFDYGMASAYVMYENTRHAEGWMDFESMIADALKILETNAQARARWQARYLIVDEAQDTDSAQFRMAQLLSEVHGNVTFVGDQNQCIYGFRGAKPENIGAEFKTWFPEGRHYYLGLNYRSTPEIVAFGRENAPAGTPKELLNRMRAFRKEKGAPIGLKMYWTDDEEAESALALSRKDPLNSIILARTNRAVGLLERLCQRHNIRYHLLGKTGFWKQNEVRKAVEALKDYPTMTTEAALSMVLPQLESKFAVDDRTERDNDALENLKTLRLIGKEHQMARDFFIYGNKMMHRRNGPRGVSISTVHQAKGLEYKNVYIIGANAKGFPHPKGDPAEEARIWYVAISRAIDVMRISFSGTPSPYLRKYLTDEILDKLREHADEVDKLQEQHALFT